MAENEAEIETNPATETAQTDEPPVATQTGQVPDASETNKTTNANTANATDEASTEQAASTEEITYHAVEKDGQVSAIWEMQGRKHLRTIDPRSRLGQEILRLYTSDHPEDEAAGSEAATTA